MGFQITDREIDRRIRKRALVKNKSLEIVRKGGVPEGDVAQSDAVPPRTVIAAYISPQEHALHRQYLANFSAVDRVRLVSQSNIDVYVLFSESAHDPRLAPGDFTALLDENGNRIHASKANSDPGDELRWVRIPPEERTLLRLLISTSDDVPALDSAALNGPFAVALQADV